MKYFVTLVVVLVFAIIHVDSLTLDKIGEKLSLEKVKAEIEKIEIEKLEQILRDLEIEIPADIKFPPGVKNEIVFKIS
jgi:hypothetical protein